MKRNKFTTIEKILIGTGVCGLVTSLATLTGGNENYAIAGSLVGLASGISIAMKKIYEVSKSERKLNKTLAKFLQENYTLANINYFGKNIGDHAKKYGSKFK